MQNRKSTLPIMLFLAWITYTVAYLCRVNISTAMDKLSVGMHVSVEYLGAASSIYFVTYAVGQLLNGFIGDRVNPHRYVHGLAPKAIDPEIVPLSHEIDDYIILSEEEINQCYENEKENLFYVQ